MNFKTLIEAYKVQVALCRNPDSGIREIFTCGIRNLENSSRNPDSTNNWNPESKSDKNPDSNIWNPIHGGNGSKSSLGFLSVRRYKDRGF